MTYSILIEIKRERLRGRERERERERGKEKERERKREREKKRWREGEREKEWKIERKEGERDSLCTQLKQNCFHKKYQDCIQMLYYTIFDLNILNLHIKILITHL